MKTRTALPKAPTSSASRLATPPGATGLLWEIFEPLVRALKPPTMPPPRHKAIAAKAPTHPDTPKLTRPAQPAALLPFQPPPAAPTSRPSPSQAQRAQIKPGAFAPFATATEQLLAAPSQGKRSRTSSPATRVAPANMQDRYDAVASFMLHKYQIRVRKWRTSMSGIAWYVTYRDGHIQRLIESPRPKGPMSVAVFLHEIGHHAIGFDVYKPRCLEEYHAWRWALEAMAEHNLNITEQVRLRMHRSLWYAVQKAKRRGIKKIPMELEPFLEKPVSAKKQRRTIR